MSEPTLSKYVDDLDIFVEDLELPADEGVPECPDADLDAIAPGIDPLYSAQKSASVSGRSLQVFLPGVSPQMQQDVQDSTLLAQLAADRAAGGGPDKDPDTWYAKYREVLGNLGWTLQTFDVREVNDANQYKNAAALILKLAEYHLTLDERAALKHTTIALARRANHRAHRVFNSCSINNKTAAFHVGLISASESGPTYKITYSTYTASKDFTSALFFPWTGLSINFRTGNQTMILNTQIYETVRQSVRDTLEGLGPRACVLVETVKLD